MIVRNHDIRAAEQESRAEPNVYLCLDFDTADAPRHLDQEIDPGIHVEEFDALRMMVSSALRLGVSSAIQLVS